MNTTRPIIDLLAYQKRAVRSTSRFCWYNWSRQTGKSFSLALKRLLRAIERRRLQVLLSAGERQSKELMEKVRMHAQAMGVVADYHEDSFFEGTSYKQLELRLPNGVRILALPANPNTARGFTGDVMLDEFAMHQHDREIWAALYPTVMRGEGELDVASTPKGKSNMFYTLRDNVAFEHDTVTILDAVEDGLAVKVDELRAGLGDDDLWRQEFLCEFLDSATALLTYEQIAECEDAALSGPVGPEEAASVIGGLGGELYAGIDVGRHRDLTVAWVVEPSAAKLITRAVIELRGLPFREQRELLWPLIEKARRTCMDASGLGMQMSEEAVEAFGAWKVEPVTFTLQVKQELAGPLAMRVQDATFTIPVSHEIRNDWHSITRSPTATGAFRYLAERTPDGHADRFWAATLANRAAGTPTGPAEAVGSERKLAFVRTGTW